MSHDDVYLTLSNDWDEGLPVLTTTLAKEQWIRDFIRAYVPQIGEDIDAGPEIIPGMTHDEAAREFLIALKVHARTDPLALAVWTFVDGVTPLAPNGHLPTAVRWAAEPNLPGSAFPAFLAHERLDGVVTYIRSQGVVSAAMQRAEARTERIMALFERAKAAGCDGTLDEAIALGLLSQEEVDAAWDILGPPQGGHPT